MSPVTPSPPSEHATSSSDPKTEKKKLGASKMQDVVNGEAKEGAAGRARASTVGDVGAGGGAGAGGVGMSRGLTTTGAAGNVSDNAIIQQWLRELTSVRAMVVIGVV